MKSFRADCQRDCWGFLGRFPFFKGSQQFTFLLKTIPYVRGLFKVVLIFVVMGFEETISQLFNIGK